MVQISEKAFVEQVQAFMGDRSWSMSGLAKSAGISSSALSQYMSGKYIGNNDNVRNKLADVMARETEKKTLAKAPSGFIKTSVAKRVFEVAHDCRLFGDIGVCYSAAGLGKTESAREYARQNSDVILIEADPGYTAKFLFSEIREEVGGSSRASLQDIFIDCCRRLKDSGRLLIVDEAEQLPYKALEMLRRLHDKTGIGILLTGMPKLLANLRGAKGEYAQLYSRIGLAVKLKPLTDGDAAAVMGKLLPGSSEAVQKALIGEAAGNTRRLFKIITRSKRVAQVNNTSITVETVRAAANAVKVEVMS
jgi:DNA transposition AAA+ family ATPase